MVFAKDGRVKSILPKRVDPLRVTLSYWYSSPYEIVPYASFDLFAFFLCLNGGYLSFPPLLLSVHIFTPLLLDVWSLSLGLCRSVLPVFTMTQTP